ncbi:hypothetical protein ACFXD5_02240 [Streptomyces sp. NPDC059385]
MEIFLRVGDAPNEEIESPLSEIQLASPRDNFVTWARQRLMARNSTAD